MSWLGLLLVVMLWLGGLLSVLICGWSVLSRSAAEDAAAAAVERRGRKLRVGSSRVTATTG